MRQLCSKIVLGLVFVLSATGWLGSQEPQDEPLDLGTSEKATVRLVLVDTVVIDAQGRTVPDLTRQDFEVFALGRRVEIDTLDVDCSIGATGEPDVVRRAARRESLPPTDRPRRIVMAFDYLHLNSIEREEALRQARELVKHGGTGTDELMVVALNGGLRIEQPLTGDTQQVLDSLRRMEYDITLWNGRYDHINEFGFVDGMTGLFDVLGTVAGPKAVVLYSGMLDVPLELQFEKLAAVASVARCSLYPVDVRGLTTEPLGGSGTPAPG